MCGIVGFYGDGNTQYNIINGLTALQHRGQDSTGIITFDKIFHEKKGMGLVSQVYDGHNTQRLTGNIGVGHNRYATQGSHDTFNIQPFSTNYPLGLAMVHNGNVINFKDLRRRLFREKHRLLETTNDLELILYALASELEQKNLKNLSAQDIFESVRKTQEQVLGAYSTITVIANKGILVFNDPFGIRPLVMGRKVEPGKTFYGFASESTCFDYLGFETLESMSAGEAVFVDNQFNVSREVLTYYGDRFCVFEYIYFSNESSVMHNRLVMNERLKMGETLAKEVRSRNINPDVVIDVPSSGYHFAVAMAKELGIPYERGLSKNNFIGRSFISPSQEMRENVVRQKLNPIKEVVAGKKVAVVDDSIVRGTTSKRIVELLKRAGTCEIYLISAAPPVRNPCIFGIDMATSSELIAKDASEIEIGKKIGVDAMVFLSAEKLRSLYPQKNICDACFTGDYPGNCQKYLADIAEERESSR